MAWLKRILKAGVRFIDYMLRKSYRLVEITQDPGCILRIQLTRAPHPVSLDGLYILKGDRVLVLHVWNERMPQIPPTGPDLEWALKIRRDVVNSFKVIATHMQTEPAYAQVRAVTGTSVLFSFSDHTGGARWMQHLGFTVLPYFRPAGRFGEFWENLFSWWLMWTYNEGSLDSRRFAHLQRTEIWITTHEFLHRYGDSASQP